LTEHSTFRCWIFEFMRVMKVLWADRAGDITSQIQTHERNLSSCKLVTVLKTALSLIDRTPSAKSHRLGWEHCCQRCWLCCSRLYVLSAVQSRLKVMGMQKHQVILINQIGLRGHHTLVMTIFQLDLHGHRLLVMWINQVGNHGHHLQVMTEVGVHGRHLQVMTTTVEDVRQLRRMENSTLIILWKNRAQHLYRLLH
jgi:hypothetical protein